MAHSTTPNHNSDHRDHSSKPGSTAALPEGIEIFKAGTHTADSGEVITFSEADVAGMVASYDPALREAPLCVGHPASNKPAFGWVASLQSNAGRLLMNTRDVVPAFAEMVGARLYKKRSASFYPPNHPSNPKPGSYYLRHVAFLGAQQPAIAGLADFSEAAADAATDAQDSSLLCFSQNCPTPPPSVELKEHPMTDTNKAAASQADTTTLADAQERIAAAKQAQEAAELAARQATEKLNEFTEARRVQREADFTQFAEGLIKDGKLPPAERILAVTAMGLFADAKPVEFSEGTAGNTTTKTLDLLQWLKDKLQSARPVVAFGEHAPAGGSAGMDAVRLQKDASDVEVDRAAQAWMRQHKDVNYAEAVAAVMSFTQ